MKLPAFYAAFSGGVRYLIAQITSQGALVIGVSGAVIFLSTLLQMVGFYELNLDMSLGETLYRYSLATGSMVFGQWRYSIAKEEERIAEEKAKWVEDVL